MSFAIYADSSCNLTAQLQQQWGIEVIPFSYERNGVLYPCPKSPEDFDGKAYYDDLRAGVMVKTSLISAGHLMDAMSPALEQGQDAVLFTLSGSISGTYAAGLQAAELLKEEYPERIVLVMDTMGSGFGTGLLALRCAQYRQEGRSLQESFHAVEEDRSHLCQYFAVDDLMFLKRSGRLSGIGAALGTMLQLKPILKGNDEGHIVVTSKVRGRKKAIEHLVDAYRKRVTDPQDQHVFISHGDCPEDAEALAQAIREAAPPKELTVCLHEPLTGAHVGPGMLALFFFGTQR